jgi:hypothetical protein
MKTSFARSRALRHLPWLTVPLLLLGALPVSWRARPVVAQANLVSAHGIVNAWRMEKDGMLYVEVSVRSPNQPPVPEEKGKRPAEDAEVGSLWFRTPADQTDATQFEDLFLDVVLQTRLGDSLLPAALTIVGEKEANKDGQSWEEAYPIVAVSQP